MNEETVTCMVCGHVTTQINYAHLTKHNMTSVEYKEKFPNSKMRVMSAKLKEKKKQQFAEMNKSKEFIENNVKKLTSKAKSNDHKQALKDAKAREDKKHRAKVNGDNRRGKKHSEESLEKIARNSAKQKHPYGGKAGTREDLGHNCRSMWEANFARILNHLGIEYEFEKIIWLTKKDGSRVIYLVDFYLPKTNSYVEIKGRWYDDAREKFELFLEQYPNDKMHLIEIDTYVKYARRYKRKVENWE